MGQRRAPNDGTWRRPGEWNPNDENCQAGDSLTKMNDDLLEAEAGGGDGDAFNSPSDPLSLSVRRSPFSSPGLKKTPANFGTCRGVRCTRGSGRYRSAGVRVCAEDSQTRSLVTTNLHLRHKQTNKRTDARNRIWCILALKCDVWWRYFNDFPENQLTEVRTGYLLVDP